MHSPRQETLVILDYGSQYTQLIARRARELGVYSIILPFDTEPHNIGAQNPLGVVLSGGPNSVYDRDAPGLDESLLGLNIPILGICYGMQLLSQTLGGKAEASAAREYGKATLQLAHDSKLLDSSFDNSTVWMSHGDHVTMPPEGFHVTARSGNVVCAIEDPELEIFGLQFHPEVTHTDYGRQILENFVGLCGFRRDWSADSIIDQQVKAIREITGSKNVICALSGGVDSSVAATLVNKAIGKQQTCIFVDTGLLRFNEYEEVLATYKKVGLNVKPVRAAKQFLGKLKGIEDPEQKRKIIGAEFIAIFEKEAKHVKNAEFLVQGTLYPDVIESVSVNGSSVTIKSHHNVGGLPAKMQLKLIEPLRELFKDEVRLIGHELGLPRNIVQRQPFPGPGLAVRIIGSVTPARVALLQQADAIVRTEIDAHPIRPRLWQYFAVLLPIKSVGVMGDGRTYEQVVAIRIVESSDGMTASWAEVPHDLLGRISSRIVSEVRGVNRVVYDITSKPPGTIEWE
ncbi:MAG TPA: glutamine-hydrolyzing GMP synthase [Candidatus Saccharimonadales bacterium]|nr:glutamine-hydrolyzing GMP synthase [Candidatus Saccharimonadales bacterium]